MFSLVLIVAIAVGYFARTTELSRDRDRDLAAAATLGAARLTAVIDATRVAAQTATGVDPSVVALTLLGADVGSLAEELDDDRLRLLARIIPTTRTPTVGPSLDETVAMLSGIGDELVQIGDELGDERLATLADRARSAASEPTSAGATRALATVYPELGVCVVTADAGTCAGDGPTPTDDVLAAATQRRADVAPTGGVATSVTIYDSLLTIEAVGPDATVVSVGPADLMDDDGGATTWATTLLPAGFEANGFNIGQDARQTWAPVESATGIFVTAAGDNAVYLPPEEYRFYLVIFSLAVVLMLLAGVTLFTEHRSLVERASFDSLTKLPNRGEFERRAAELMSSAERTEIGICLLLFDLNGFKKVNDTYGHAAGDQMLRLVGVRLRKAVRDGDIVARWGGDEFVAMMPGISSLEMGSRRACQLAEQISGRARLDGVQDPLRVKVSVGVAIWPDNGADLADLVIAADEAMYEAKRNGVMCLVAEPAPTPVPPPLPATRIPA